MSGVTVRSAAPSDAAVIDGFIRELADYEREPDAVRSTPELIARWLFGPDPAAEALIAERDGAPIGFALFYRSFSTWEATPGLWLEDLFVRAEHRRCGAGRQLLACLAALTVDRGYTRLEWTALEWNTPALDFYRTVGAELMSEWKILRLHGDGLARLAAPAP